MAGQDALVKEDSDERRRWALKQAPLLTTRAVFASLSMHTVRRGPHPWVHAAALTPGRHHVTLPLAAT